MFLGDQRGLSTRWFVALSRCGEDAVEEAIAEVRARFDVSALGVPEGGIYLASSDEVTLPGANPAGDDGMARAAVLLRDRATGEEFRGGAMVVREEADLAEAMAICDAVVRHRPAGWEKLATLAAEGTAIILEEERTRGDRGSDTRLDLPDLSGGGLAGSREAAEE